MKCITTGALLAILSSLPRVPPAGRTGSVSAPRGSHTSARCPSRLPYISPRPGMGAGAGGAGCCGSFARCPSRLIPPRPGMGAGAGGGREDKSRATETSSPQHRGWWKQGELCHSKAHNLMPSCPEEIRVLA